MDYFQKYLKYKNKYNELLQKKGGALIFNDYNDTPQKVLLKTKMEGDNLKYSIPSGASNNFTVEEKKNLEIMTNYILPHISYKGKKLGYNFVKNVETFGAGTFGVAIAYDNLIVKVMKVKYSLTIPLATKEILILEELFNTPGQVPPENLSKYYGFIADKSIAELKTFDTYNKTDIKITSSLFTKPEFKIDDFKDIIVNLNRTFTSKDDKTQRPGDYLKTNFFDNMILAFFDKEDGDIDKFIEEICPTLSIEQKVLATKDFFEDISWGLDFIHRVKKQFHADIKSANLVYKRQPDGTFKFKIIDFGSLMPIDPVTGKGTINVATSFYYKGTNYFKSGIGFNFSYMYDYFCTLCVVLEIWGAKVNDISAVCSIMNGLYDFYRSKKNMDVLIEGLIIFVKKYYLIDLPLPNPSKPQIKETYELLIPFFIQGNIPTGTPSPLA